MMDRKNYKIGGYNGAMRLMSLILIFLTSTMKKKYIFVGNALFQAKLIFSTTRLDTSKKNTIHFNITFCLFSYIHNVHPHYSWPWC